MRQEHREEGSDDEAGRERDPADAIALRAARRFPAILDDADYQLFLKAFASNGNGKVLAEPTLVASFLDGSKGSTHDPYLCKGMIEAVDRLNEERRAIETGVCEAAG